MKNMIELGVLMGIRILKGLQRYFLTNQELFWNVKTKNGDFGKKRKTLKH